MQTGLSAFLNEGKGGRMEKFNLTRRSFVKLAAATGAVAMLVKSAPQGLAEDSGSMPDTSGVKKIRSACRGCGKMECGVWVTVEEGRAIKIEGDMDMSFQSDGNCCTKSQASLQACYHPDRLRYPMKRTNPKGDGDPGWVRISWDEALETHGEKIKEIQEKLGGPSLFTIGGTSRVWSMQPYGTCKIMYGTPNGVLAWQICKGPRQLGTRLTDEWGSHMMAVVDRPSVYVQWGNASEMSNYDDSCRVCVDAATKADCHIIVDPRVTNLGKEADYHLPLRPGTDGAMAMCWTHIIIENNLYDDLFCRRWTNGPFLAVEGLEPSGYKCQTNSGYVDLTTRILKESDLKEDGLPWRYMVWDELAGTDEAHPLHNNDPSGHLTYYDVETAMWEGEDWKPPTDGWYDDRPNVDPRVQRGWIPDDHGFNPEISPALFGDFEFVLKDGKAYKATPIFQLYAERVAEYAPDKIEAITDVAGDLVEEACLKWATRIDPRIGNGGIQYTLACEQSANSTDNVRALALLSAITGNNDGPAGNRGSTRAPVDASPGMPMFPPMGPADPNGPTTFEQNEMMLGGDKFPILRWFGGWSDATAVYDAIHTGEPYPVVGGICQSGDFMHQANASYNWEALKKLDFFIDVDLWHHPTSEQADIILPARHWLEVDSPRLSQGASGGIGATCKCVEPLAESWYDVDIAIQLSKSVDFPFSFITPDNFWPDSIENLNACVVGMGETWEEFKEIFQKEGWRDPKKLWPDRWGTYFRYMTGAQRQANGYVQSETDHLPGWGTPTRKCEIWSLICESYLQEDMLDHCMPKFTNAPHSREADPERFKEYPLFATTGRRIPVYFHSEHRQLPWCRELWPVPRIEMHPDDADEIGVKQGDWVWIETEWGKIRESVDLYYGIQKGIVNLEHQWWFPEMEAPSHGFELSCVNCIVDKDAQDPICGSTSLRSYPVKVYKAEEGAPVSVGGIKVIESSDDPRLKAWAPVYEGRDQ
jgi:anaerobic selenocysteine-containing dehydrogenase